MNSDGLIRALCRILDAIRRILSLPTAIDGDTVSNTVPKPGASSDTESPPETGVPLETTPGQDTVTEPDREHPVPEPTPDPESETTLKPVADTLEDAGNGNDHQHSPHPEVPPPEENNKSPKQPVDSPGRRGTSIGQKPLGRERTPPEAKPELICQETRDHRGPQGQIFLRVPRGKSFEVSQNGTKLSVNDNDNYLLTNFKKKIHWTDGNSSEQIELFSNNRPLIFKLGKNWDGNGRHVPRISSGYYLVFAPREWHRTNEASVSELECTDRDFLAHYFYSDGAGTADGFKECGSFVKRERFSLDGTTVADDASMGELYVGDVPKLDDSKNWEGISWIKVGKEDGDKWAEDFKPNESTLADVLQGREGRFFIRIFDVKLIHSMDFRYLAGLEKILVNGEPHHSDNSITPSDNGYTGTVIQFVGEIKAESENKDIAVNKDNTATIDPLPDLDKTQWTLIGKTEQVTITLHLPRIWWQLVNSDTISAEWKDTPLVMSQGMFIDNRDAEMVVRLPPEKKGMRVSFGGFHSYDGGRKYHKDRKTNESRFDLREFRAHEQITETPSEESNLSIQCGSVDFPIIRIPANKPTQPPAPKPPANNIRYSKKGFAYPATGNKRFSRAECDKAGLIDDDVNRLKISIDSRRGTKCNYNASLLRNLQGGNHAT